MLVYRGVNSNINVYILVYRGVNTKLLMYLC